MAEYTTKEIRTIYHLDGMMSGALWMPNEMNEFSFHETLYKQKENPFQKEFYNLYSALCDIQNDGDFRSLTFTENVRLTVVKEFNYYNEQGFIVNSEKKIRHFEISKEMKEYSILFE